MPKSESGVSAAWEQMVPKHSVKHFETKIECLHKVLLIQAYQQILGKILCFASERRTLMARFQFSCQMLVVIPAFTHQTVKSGGKAGYQILQKCNSEGERFQGGHLVTKITSATGLPTVAVTPSHTKDRVSLFSAGPSFLLLSAGQS